MSSDSDPDEFYDACDVTPQSSAGLSPAPILQRTSEIGFEKYIPLQPTTGIGLNKIVPQPVQPLLVDKCDRILEVFLPNELLNNSLSVCSAGNKPDRDDCGSACSGSLLDTLGDDDHEDLATPIPSAGKRRLRHLQVRSRGEDDPGGDPPESPEGSRSSSTDGVYPAGRTSHPFRVVEHDNASVYSTVSQGKSGKILEPSKDSTNSLLSQMGTSVENTKRIVETPTVTEKPIVTELFHRNSIEKQFVPPVNVGLPVMSPEPDLVASTKSSSGSEKSNSLPRPILTSTPLESAPQRQILISEVLQSKSDLPPTRPTYIFEQNLPPVPLTKQLPAQVSSQTCAVPMPVAPPRRRRKNPMRPDDDTISMSSVSSLPSPTLTMSSSDAISMGHSLDIRQAVRGDYVVKPQDLEQSRAAGPTEDDLGHQDSEDTASQASSPEVSRVQSRVTLPLASSGEVGDCISHHMTGKTDSYAHVMVQSDSQVEMNQMFKTRSDSGKELSDVEILNQITVLNLDTGERIPLSEAEDSLPKALNPLSLHIMRLTSEYPSASNENAAPESDEESITDIKIGKLPQMDAISKKIKAGHQLKKFFGRKVESAKNKARSLSTRHREEKDVFEDDTPAHDTMQYVKIKTSHGFKGPHEFDNLMYVQEIKEEHQGPIWCMKFSGCGRLLATAGQDHVLRVWVLKQAFHYFLDIRTRCNADIKVSPTPSQESLVSQHSGQSGDDMGSLDPNDDGCAPFMPKPFCIYNGHTADMLDISWSKNYFILTSSMDKTVRLWHISRKECLCIFQHMDFVTAIAFHPKDDRYFISGALDGKLRLWSIPDKRVVLWNEVTGLPNLITAANFCQNGKFTVVGTYDGRCIFYETEQLKYYTQLNVRSSRGKNAKGRKITGLEPVPGEDKVLITSNDSRIRLYDLRDLSLSCKYKGYSNVSSQIRAGFSHDGKFIVAGSENQCVYIWKTCHDVSNSKVTSARKDRNVYWEGVKAHSAVVTCAVFAPHPEIVFAFMEQQQDQKGESVQPTGGAQGRESSSANKGYVLVSADFNGCIKVFWKKEKPKHSSLPASALS